MPSAQLASSARNLRFRHFPQLDGLRGAAILLVITSHVLEFGLGIERGRSLGGFGVLLFFVLSGFLITGLLDREILKTGHISLSQFYFRRVLRLFPALFCFLAVLSLLIKLRLVTDTPWYTVAACLLYVRNLGGLGLSSAHIWSLSIEEQFYLFWPWIMRAFSRRGSLWAACLGVVAFSTFRMTAIHWKLFSYEAGVFYLRSWFRFDSILIGCVAALWLCQSDRLDRIRPHFSGLTISLLLWPAALAWTWWGEAETHVWYLTIQTVLAALILVNLLLSKSTGYLSVFSNPVAAWFGRISYSWYLWQQLFTVIRTPAWLGLRTVPINIAVSLLIAIISYRFVEQPFLRLRDRVAQPEPNIEAIAV